MKKDIITHYLSQNSTAVNLLPEMKLYIYIYIQARFIKNDETLFVYYF